MLVQVQLPGDICLAELVDAVDSKSISLLSIGSSPIAVNLKSKRGVIGNISVCQAVSCRFKSGRSRNRVSLMVKQWSPKPLMVVRFYHPLKI